MTATAMEIAERAGAFLLILASVNACAAVLLPNRVAVAAVTIAAAIAALVPFGALSINDYVFSLLGPLSAGSLLILIVALADRLVPDLCLEARLRLWVLACILILAGVPFYALVLGSGDVDVYRLGFGGSALPLALAALLLVGVVMRALSVALWIALGGALYLTGAYASRNLLDYLIDPVAIILAAIVLARASSASVRPSGFMKSSRSTSPG